MGLDSVEIVIDWEEEFGIVITDAEATVLRTPRQAMDLITTKLAGEGRVHPGGPWTSGEIRRVVRKVVTDTTGRDDFGDDDDFVYDIGID